MWLIAINYSAGEGRGSAVGVEVINFFADRNLPYQVFSAHSAKELRNEIDSFLNLNSVYGVICVGGDGLTHLILQVVVPRGIAFAVIPAGNRNDFLRSLGWSLDEIKSELNCIISTPPQPIDLGNVDSEWFATILYTGFDSVLNQKADTLRWLSRFPRYKVAMALELPRFKPLTYEISTDTFSFHTEAMLIAVANGRSFGGGMQIAPQAQLHDGLFDIVIIEPVGKLEFLKLLALIYSGSHINHPKVKMLRSSKVKISAAAIAYADGERIGFAPISAECIKGVGLTWIL